MAATLPQEQYALSPSEAAAYAGVTRQTIYTWLERGLIPSTKIGRNRRIPRHALESLLDGEVCAHA